MQDNLNSVCKWKSLCWKRQVAQARTTESVRTWPDVASSQVLVGNIFDIHLTQSVLRCDMLPIFTVGIVRQGNISSAQTFYEPGRARSSMSSLSSSGSAANQQLCAPSACSSVSTSRVSIVLIADPSQQKHGLRTNLLLFMFDLLGLEIA